MYIISARCGGAIPALTRRITSSIPVPSMPKTNKQNIYDYLTYKYHWFSKHSALSIVAEIDYFITSISFYSNFIFMTH